MANIQWFHDTRNLQISRCPKITLPSHLSDWMKLTQLTSFIDILLVSFISLSCSSFYYVSAFCWFLSHLFEAPKTISILNVKRDYLKASASLFLVKILTVTGPNDCYAGLVFHLPTFAVLCFDLSPHDLYLFLLFYPLFIIAPSCHSHFPLLAIMSYNINSNDCLFYY